ncbi:hypothetical protein Y032_0177g597 [Ancylostoma ceylanicum]|nr:hypothetical protein Y032_0177g597 [Ancylostoma ceylanicum]
MDQQEPTQNKRLREMFRLFQRTRKQKEKAKERAAEEEQKPSHRSRHASSPTPSKRPVAQSPHSPTAGQRPSKEKQKSPYLPKKQASAEETTTVVDDEDVADESPSAKKRRRIRKKYGIHTKDEEFFQRASKDDVEEFENVAVAIRPAATKMRKAKLRWKTAESPAKEKPEKEQDSSATTEAGANTSWDEPTAAEKAELHELDPTQSHEEERTLNPKYAEKFAKLKEKPQEKIEELLKEIYALLMRVEELEQAQSKFLAQIRLLRARVAVRDKKISDLSRKVEPSTSASASAGSVASTSAASEVEKTVCDEEKPSPKLEAVALRGLDIMKRNQLLEQTVNEKEAEVLVKFFESEESKPDKTVVMLIDKAFNYGLEVLLMRPDLFEDYVDNELRLFLLDAPRIRHCIDDSFGSGAVAARALRGRERPPPSTSTVHGAIPSILMFGYWPQSNQLIDRPIPLRSQLRTMFPHRHSVSYNEVQTAVEKGQDRGAALWLSAAIPCNELLVKVREEAAGFQRHVDFVSAQNNRAAIPAPFTRQFGVHCSRL